MGTIFTKTFTYVFIIFLAYGLKRAGFLKKEDYRVLFKLMVNVSVPAVVVNSFAGLKMDASLLALVLFNIGLNLILLLAGFVLTCRSSQGKRALYMMNVAGYNTGGFVISIVQAFTSDPMGVVSNILFDFGNSIMCTSANVCITSAVLNAGKSQKSFLRTLVSKLSRSMPFLTALVMILIRAVRIDLPVFVTETASTLAAANGFLAMFTIGLMFDIEWNKAYFRSALSILGVRYAINLAAAAGFYFLAPFSLVTRQTIAIILFAPMSSLSPVFTEECGGDGALSSFTLSLSIVFSMLFMMGAMAIV